jgi:hypothetical protein
MRIIFVAIMMLVSIVAVAHAQRLNDEYVTDQDIQIRFPGAEASGADQWHNPPITLPIEYSAEPLLGYHKNKAKLGPQKWEFELQVDMPVFEKCIVEIEPPVPYGFRVMEIRVRVRADRDGPDDTIVPEIGPWSEIAHTKIIGKPGNPFLGD